MRRGTRQGAQSGDVIWEFFTFPVYFGAAGAAFLTCLLLLFIPWYPLFLISLAGFSFAVAHWVFTGGRKRGIRRKLQRAEEEEIERRVLAERAARDAAGETSRRSRRRRRIG